MAAVVAVRAHQEVVAAEVAEVAHAPLVAAEEEVAPDLSAAAVAAARGRLVAEAAEAAEAVPSVR